MVVLACAGQFLVVLDVSVVNVALPSIRADLGMSASGRSTMTSDGGYVTSIMGPGILMMLGAGLASTPLASLATSGAAPGEAGLVSGMVNTSRTMGGSLGLAVLSTLAAARTGGADSPEALTEGYALAFRVGTGVLAGAVVLMLVWLPRKIPAG